MRDLWRDPWSCLSPQKEQNQETGVSSTDFYEIDVFESMKQSVGALDCFAVQRDRALEIMKNKELDNIAKLTKADKEIKSLIIEVMKQPARAQLDKVSEDESSKSIIKRRMRRRNRQKASFTTES
ncbi:hypothetical protein QYF36_022779 [Acer negundo]|nr:hypothetical protein QYF36_022779 [Acer negundo]